MRTLNSEFKGSKSERLTLNNWPWLTEHDVGKSSVRSKKMESFCRQNIKDNERG